MYEADYYFKVMRIMCHSPSIKMLLISINQRMNFTIPAADNPGLSVSCVAASIVIFVFTMK